MHINMDAQVRRQAKQENIRVVRVRMQGHGGDLTPGSSNAEALEREEQQIEAADIEHHIQCTTKRDFFFFPFFCIHCFLISFGPPLR